MNPIPSSRFHHLFVVQPDTLPNSGSFRLTIQADEKSIDVLCKKKLTIWDRIKDLFCFGRLYQSIGKDTKKFYVNTSSLKKRCATVEIHESKAELVKLLSKAFACAFNSKQTPPTSPTPLAPKPSPTASVPPVELATWTSSVALLKEEVSNAFGSTITENIPKICAKVEHLLKEAQLLDKVLSGNPQHTKLKKDITHLQQLNTGLQEILSDAQVHTPPPAVEATSLSPLTDVQKQEIIQQAKENLAVLQPSTMIGDVLMNTGSINFTVVTICPEWTVPIYYSAGEGGGTKDEWVLFQAFTATSELAKVFKEKKIVGDHPMLTRAREVMAILNAGLSLKGKRDQQVQALKGGAAFPSFPSLVGEPNQQGVINANKYLEERGITLVIPHELQELGTTHTGLSAQFKDIANEDNVHANLATRYQAP